MKKGVTIKEEESGFSTEFSKEEKQRMEKSWANSLIIKLLGETIGFMQLCRKVQTMWGRFGKVELSDIGSGYIIATFSSREDYLFALDGGPWVIQNHYLTVQTWKRNFNPGCNKIQRVAIWVRLPGLPGDYYDRKFFYNLGNKIGRAIRVDEMTLKRERTMYARMCVEIDLNAPLLPSYVVDGNKLKIEYEGLHLICFSCGKFGHDAEHCPSGKNKPAESGREANQPPCGAVTEKMVPVTLDNKTGGKYGEWMVVHNGRKGRQHTARDGKVNVKENKGGKFSGQTRFDVLTRDEDCSKNVEDEFESRTLLQEKTNLSKKKNKGVAQTITSMENGVEKVQESIRNQKSERNGKKTNGGIGKSGETEMTKLRVTDKEENKVRSQTVQKNKDGLQMGQAEDKSSGLVRCSEMGQRSGDKEREIDKGPLTKNGEEKEQEMGCIVFSQKLKPTGQKDAEVRVLEEIPPDPGQLENGLGHFAKEKVIEQEE